MTDTEKRDPTPEAPTPWCPEPQDFVDSYSRRISMDDFTSRGWLGNDAFPAAVVSVRSPKEALEPWEERYRHAISTINNSAKISA